MSGKDKKNVFIFFSGRCTEFNVDGGVIQIHNPTPCGNEKFPNCFQTYKSSEAYKCKTTYLLNFLLFLKCPFLMFLFFYLQYDKCIHLFLLLTLYNNK